MICKHHPNYVPGNGDPEGNVVGIAIKGSLKHGPCPYCWRARSHWLHENRKLHIAMYWELQKKATHFTPNSRIEFLEAQVSKLKKQLARK